MDLNLVRFVDDYLVLVKDCPCSIMLPEMIKTFQKNGVGLEYAFELP